MHVLVGFITIFVIAFFFGALYIEIFGPYVGPLLPFILLPVGYLIFRSQRHVERSLIKVFGYLTMLASVAFFFSTAAFVLGQRAKMPKGTPLAYFDKGADLFLIGLIKAPGWLLDNFIGIVWSVIGILVCYGLWKYNEIGKEKARARANKHSD
ncbi:hypothetical protein KW428_21820 [Vibrio fluvialis]|uniref:hypothetical protein n=1 Tax=Vibrio fluvialis TaxID=676 RepID=UPI001C9C6367|nr:hypothetical protein [Vibrio fluvialis]ELS3717392.1 hypothetical protein [Vibrio fluvialis]ELX9694089.1 hypothetical protein [Vibrio fluvialis]MBY7865298.1 hypothetical protein [Vibrio fluvialis]MBY8092580.1 hypothetical protein [Vibrio fluvialis]WMN57875.1 hypothetical protein NI390_16425 [Vibrio fluvialis]